MPNHSESEPDRADAGDEEGERRERPDLRGHDGRDHDGRDLRRGDAERLGNETGEPDRIAPKPAAALLSGSFH